MSAANARQLMIDPQQASGVISPLLFGHNLEHTRRAMWRGLSAQMLANRKFASGAGARTAEGSDVGVRGAPGPDGVAARWNALPGARVTFQHDSATGYAGKESQLIKIPAGSSGGLWQAGLHIRAGTHYRFRMFVHSDAECRVLIRVRSERDLANHAAPVLSGGWRECAFEFSAAISAEDARIELSFAGPAQVRLGAVSLLPADNFLGLRRDVVGLLKEISVPVLRWPGGNFILDYPWKDGLLPVDQRPPIKSRMAETLPLSDNCDFHEIGIDEFIALCRHLNAEPFITVNVCPAESGTPQEAADWIEYCNGSPETKWGAVRASRGQREPYAVKLWSIGNENWGAHMLEGHFDASTYSRHVAAFAPAMHKADPSITLVGVGMPAQIWDGIVAAEAGAHMDWLSAHDYFRHKGAAPVTYKDFADAPQANTAQKLKLCRETIDAKCPAGKKIGIAFDEWNRWHLWFANPVDHVWDVGPQDGAFAAAMLNMLCRETHRLNIPLAALFQPVNEGAIAVAPSAAELTTLGQAYKAFRVHHGQRAITLEDSGIDAAASVSVDGKRVAITIVSHDPGNDETIELALPSQFSERVCRVHTFRAADLTPDVPFQETHFDTRVNAKGSVAVTVPQYGLVCIDIP